jgi:hypothetical protein
MEFAGNLEKIEENPENNENFEPTIPVATSHSRLTSMIPGAIFVWA